VRAFLFKEKNFYWFLAAIFLVAIGPLVSNGMNAYFFSIVMYAGINIILAVSLNLVNGFTGQFSIGHAGFMSVGLCGIFFISFFISKLFFFNDGAIFNCNIFSSFNY
jgi:branched-chain amino acid transport system permease protein